MNFLEALQQSVRLNGNLRRRAWIEEGGKLYRPEMRFPPAGWAHPPACIPTFRDMLANDWETQTNLEETDQFHEGATRDQIDDYLAKWMVP